MKWKTTIRANDYRIYSKKKVKIENKETKTKNGLTILQYTCKYKNMDGTGLGYTTVSLTFMSELFSL